MGQSAGAGSAFSLQASPAARGLFHRIVGMSGGGMRFGVELPTQLQAEASGLELEKALGVDSLEALRNIPADRILAAQAEFQLGGTAGTVRFRPNLDAHFMPKQPRETFAAGEQNDVPLLLGFTRDESSNELRAAKDLAQFREAASKYFGDRSGEFLRLYPATETDVSAVGAQAARDGGMATSMRSWAYGQMKKGRQPVYLYMYSHEHSYAPGAVIADLNPQSAGAYHSSEIPFFLLTLDAYNRIRPTRAWTDQDHALAATMSEVLIAFASSGNPQTPSLRLPRFDARREQLIEFGDEVKVISFNKPRMEFFSTVNAPGAVGPAPRRECRATEEAPPESDCHGVFVMFMILATMWLSTSVAAAAPALDVPVDASPVLEDRFPQLKVAFGADVESLPDLVYSAPPGFRPLRLDLYRPRNTGSVYARIAAGGVRTWWRLAVRSHASRGCVRQLAGSAGTARVERLRRRVDRVSAEWGSAFSSRDPGREDFDPLAAVEERAVWYRPDARHHLGRFRWRTTGGPGRDFMQRRVSRAGVPEQGIRIRNRPWQRSRIACRDW